MPVRGGRVGGGSRGGRVGGGFRAPRTGAGSSGGSRGIRIPTGNRAPRTGSTSSTPTLHRPFLRPRMSLPSGPVWKIIALILGALAFGGCACVGLGLILQALGYGR